MQCMYFCNTCIYTEVMWSCHLCVMLVCQNFTGLDITRPSCYICQTCSAVSALNAATDYNTFKQKLLIFASRDMTGPRKSKGQSGKKPGPVGIRTQVNWFKDEHATQQRLLTYNIMYLKEIKMYRNFQNQQHEVHGDCFLLSTRGDIFVERLASRGVLCFRICKMPCRGDVR